MLSLQTDGRRSAREFPDSVQLGRGSIVDADALLGLEPPRVPRAQWLRIGAGGTVRSGAALYIGSAIGMRADIGHNSVVREDCDIGDEFCLGNNSVIGPGCVIGTRVRVDSNCDIGPFTTLEDDVHIGSGVTTASDPHPGSGSHLCMRGPSVLRGAQIGVNATLLPFVVVGSCAVIGAGSVVTKDIRARGVAVGNPARVIKSVAEVRCALDLRDGEYLRDQRSIATGGRSGG